MFLNKYIKSFALFFLAFYAISNYGSLFLHHHSELAPVATATTCEKSISYKESKNECGHQNHITQRAQKCELCLLQFNLLVYFVALKFEFNTPLQQFKFYDFYSVLQLIVKTEISNKGPPSILFYFL